MADENCSKVGGGGGMGGPMKFGDPVILTDEKGVEHPTAHVIHAVEAYPDWARIVVLDVKRVPAPKVGDHDVETLLTKTVESVVIVERSAKPVPGKATFRPVPTAIP